MTDHGARQPGPIASSPRRPLLAPGGDGAVSSNRVASPIAGSDRGDAGEPADRDGNVRTGVDAVAQLAIKVEARGSDGAIGMQDVDGRVAAGDLVAVLWPTICTGTVELVLPLLPSSPSAA